MRTGLLPLENIPKGQEMYSLALSVALGLPQLKTRMEMLAKMDEYARLGGYGEGLEMKEDELDGVEEKLNRLMKGWEGRTSKV